MTAVLYINPTEDALCEVLFLPPGVASPETRDDMRFLSMTNWGDIADDETRAKYESVLDRINCLIYGAKPWTYNKYANPEPKGIYGQYLVPVGACLELPHVTYIVNGHE